MKIFLCSLVMLALSISNVTAGDVRQLSGGWRAFTKQSDPFDNSKVEIIQIIKDDFTFRCGELNMAVSSYGFESLSFHADLKYMIDDQVPVEKQGYFSTYLGGSDIVTDSRYFSFKLNSEDIAAMKAGTKIKVAGKYSNSNLGWQTKNLSLEDFTSAYNQMCK